MDLRKDLGGMAEAALNEAVDKALGDNSDLFVGLAEKIAKELQKALGANLAEKIKANWIDKLDGEDDIPDVD